MLKNFKIGKKLFLTFILVAVILSIGGIINLFMMSNMNSQYSGALYQYGFSQGDIGIFSTEINNSSAIVRQAISDTDLAEVNSKVQQYKTQTANMNGYLAKMEKGMANEAEKKLFAAIKEDYASYLKANEQIIQLAQQNADEVAVNMLDGQCVPLTDKINSNVLQLINLKTNTGTQIADQLNAQNRTASVAVIGIMAIALLFSLAIAKKISGGISSPVKKMAAAAQDMANGNLDVQIDVRSSDEIGELGASLNQTVESLNAYIEDIKTNLDKVAHGDMNITPEAEFKGDFVALKDSILQIVSSFNHALVLIDQASKQISVGSDQVSGTAQALAQGASEQASTVEELTAAIERISTHVKRNAEHAVKASNDVTLVSEEIESSNKLMNEMTDAMSNISKSSEQIKHIIKTIDDIAFQTNILALNAAVEAARAGAAGRGFSVVADEVRNLASKSAEAAKDTTVLIENSTKQVESGNRLVDVTAQSLLRVMERAQSTAETVHKISESTKDQSTAILQVTHGVEQISAVVQTNSATAEESAAASEELAGQAQALQSLLKQFKLRQQGDDFIGTSSQPITIDETEHSEEERPSDNCEEPINPPVLEPADYKY